MGSTLPFSLLAFCQGEKKEVQGTVFPGLLTRYSSVDHCARLAARRRGYASLAAAAASCAIARLAVASSCCCQPGRVLLISETRCSSQLRWSSLRPARDDLVRTQ